MSSIQTNEVKKSEQENNSKSKKKNKNKSKKKKQEQKQEQRTRKQQQEKEQENNNKRKNKNKNKEQEKIDHLKEIRVWLQIVGVGRCLSPSSDSRMSKLYFTEALNPDIMQSSQYSLGTTRVIICRQSPIFFTSN